MASLTIAQALQRAPLLHAVSESPRLDIELILCHILQKNRTWLYTWPDHLLADESLRQFETCLARRETGEPIAHIIGEREFWSLPLLVNNSTLIPRPDTEVVVEQVLASFAEDAPTQVRRCLDLGTGTGAIALALASEKKHWQVLAVDRSADAVALARTNVARLRLPNVQVLCSDWFSAIPAQTFDVIVSNPPYIDPQDSHLEQGDVRFEPRSALVAGNAGLADIEAILEQAPAYLAVGGWLLIEHGYDQGRAVRDLFCASGLVQVSTRRDYAHNERVTFGQRA